jgi:hypothetical protein
MRTFVKLSLAAAAGVFALGAAGLHAAKAADMQVPQAQMQPPPPDYYRRPPVEEGYAYPPPPVMYGYPPPPPVAYGYAAPPFVGRYYAYGRGPYWRGYGPRYAYGYGYGHWRRFYRR